MTANNENERRGEKRWEVCLDAVWEGKSGNYNARVTDLSEGGCYIDTMGEASEGEILNFKVLLPGGDWLLLSGEVAHKNAPLGFGVRFADLTEDQLEKLRTLIDELQRPHNPVTAILSF
jgi:PilZ domain